MLPKHALQELFENNKFKLDLIEKHVPDNTESTVYKLGDFIDLCEGPHIPDTSYIQAF